MKEEQVFWCQIFSSSRWSAFPTCLILATSSYLVATAHNFLYSIRGPPGWSFIFQIQRWRFAFLITWCNLSASILLSSFGHIDDLIFWSVLKALSVVPLHKNSPFFSFIFCYYHLREIWTGVLAFFFLRVARFVWGISS